MTVPTSFRTNTSTLFFFTSFIFTLSVLLVELRANLFMQMFGMPISFQSIALIITSTSIAAGLTRPMINTAYYPIVKYIYSLTSFYSYVHYLLYPMSNLLLVSLCFLMLISMFVGLLAFFLCSILVEFRLLIF